MGRWKGLGPRASGLGRNVGFAGMLVVVGLLLPVVRHRVIHAVTTFDAEKSDGVTLPGGEGAGLAAVGRVRVVLIDGLSMETAKALPAWSAMCDRGLRLTIDVGFPTISLPVESALWTGLTQQQSGIVFRSDRPIEPPLAGIPAHVPGSIAIAESHGYIVRSLGFAHAEPPAAEHDAAKDLSDPTWKGRFERVAMAAIDQPARLVFVHVLRVDVAGHAKGRDSELYRDTAREADALLLQMTRAVPDARWFLLSDHGHLPGGGHGGEERAVRQVEGCIVGPGIAPARGGPVHVVDIARAIADSAGVALDPASPARPLSVALATPLGDDAALPRLSLGRRLLAIVLIALGLAATAWGMTRRAWLAPAWFALAVIALVAVRGEPTLSMSMVYRPEGRAMYVTWLAALPITAVATWFGLGVTTLPRVIAAQLALPAAVLLALVTACGAWPMFVGAEVAPVVPRFTAWLSPALLVTAHGSLAVALAVLGRTARSAFGRRAPAETPRTGPAAS
jgi:hypothetical protein